MPQDPAAPTPPVQSEAIAGATISELHYINQQGTLTVVAARNLVEVRLIEDRDDHIQLELIYENGDYSLINAQAFHLIRNGTGSREVRFVRSKPERMRFPRLP
jgi:hypothetical protein